MKIRLQFFSIALAGAALLGLAGCGGGGGSNVATVNGEPITMDQFHKYLEAKPEVQVVLENGEVANARVSETLAYQALQDLIRQRMIVQLAKDMKLAPNDAEVAAEVKFQVERESNFVNALKARGLSMDQIRESLRVDLAREHLLSDGIKVTDEDVAVFLKNNKNLYTTPMLVDAKWVFVKDQAKQREVDRDIAAGTSFAQIAIRYSDDPNAKENAGQFPRRDVDALPKSLSDPLKKTPIGSRTPWIKLSDGFAIFTIEKRTEAKYNEPTKTERQWIKRQLAVQRGIASNDLDKRLLDKLKKSKIDVFHASLKDPWKQTMEKLEKTGKPTDEGGTDTGTGTTPTTPEKPGGN